MQIHHYLIQVLVMEGVGRRNPIKEIRTSMGGKEEMDEGRGREADMTNDQDARPNGLVYCYKKCSHLLCLNLHIVDFDPFSRRSESSNDTESERSDGSRSSSDDEKNDHQISSRKMKNLKNADIGKLSFSTFLQQ